MSQEAYERYDLYKRCYAIASERSSGVIDEELLAVFSEELTDAMVNDEDLDEDTAAAAWEQAMISLLFRTFRAGYYLARSELQGDEADTPLSIALSKDEVASLLRGLVLGRLVVDVTVEGP